MDNEWLMNWARMGMAARSNSAAEQSSFALVLAITLLTDAFTEACHAAILSTEPPINSEAENG